MCIESVVTRGSITSHNAEATRYLLAAGIGQPRVCFVKIAGRRNYVTESNRLLPYCIHATNHVGNIIFLLDLFKIPNRRRATILRVITPELTYQGRKASQAIQLKPVVVARATVLLQSGNVVDWVLAFVIGHLYATDATVTLRQLQNKIAMVSDAELQIHLVRLLATKRKRQT